MRLYKEWAGKNFLGDGTILFLDLGGDNLGISFVLIHCGAYLWGLWYITVGVLYFKKYNKFSSTPKPPIKTMTHFQNQL